MFGNMLFRSKEECLCQKYSSLMNRAYKVALTDKKKSDKLNARARKILEELRSLNYKGLDKCF
jgi:hypothetical protein